MKAQTAPTRKTITVIVSLTIMVLCLTLSGWLLISKAFQDTNLPEPGPQPAPPGESVQIFMDAAVRNNGTPHMTRTFTLDRRDQQRFRRHLENISAQRGWYAFQDNNAITLIIPAEDLQDIKEMTQHPAEWTMTQFRAPRMTPPAPDSNKLVKVRLHPINSIRVKETLLAMAAIVLWIIAGILAILLIPAVHEVINKRTAKTTAPGHQRT